MSLLVHVTFIHGLANKPAPKVLERIWLDALKESTPEDEGFDLHAVGVSTSIVYWADLFYETPIPASEYECYESRNKKLEWSVPYEPDIQNNNWAKLLMNKLGGKEGDDFDDAPTDDNVEKFERIPIPKPLKKLLISHFVKEAHDYLFNVNGIRDEIRKRVMDDFKNVPDDTVHVLVGHSQGTFIAYDVLTGIPDCKKIDGFMTVGSPLGIDEVQDELEWSRENGFPSKLSGKWINVYDPFDAVARLDPILANDFMKEGEEVIIDVKEENVGTWRHSVTKYFKRPQLRSHLRCLCCRED